MIVYADHVPATTVSGEAFVNPFTDLPEDADDTPTRILVSRSPGLRLPLGTGAWGVAAWGKYVLIGNYDENGVGVFQTIADQVVGVFDSETHAFCQLDIDPSAQTNASVQWLAVADPAAPQTRIYFEGIVAPDGPPGASFGYIEADIGNPSPCDPVTGWRVVRFTAADLNAAAPPTVPPCPSGCCGFDGLMLLDGESLLGNWLTSRIVVARVGDGVISQAWVHLLPHWQPLEGSGACYVLRPVARAAVDPTRTAGDLRFALTFDVGCFADDPDNPQPPTCTPFVGLCPTTGATCPQQGCPGYCERSFFGSYQACTQSSDCSFDFFCGQHVDLGACTTACLQTHPSMVCSGSRSQHCTQDANCPPGQRCLCNRPYANPAQEYRFDGTSITPTSGFFQAAPNTAMTSLGRYDSLGNLWLSASSRNGAPYNGVPVLYFRQGGGHGYDSTATTRSMVVTPDQSDLCFEGSNIFCLPVDANQVGNAMYLLGRRTLQRTLLGSDGWVKDTPYKRSFGMTVLPSEAHVCTSVPWCARRFCDAAHPCAAGSCVPDESSAGEWIRANIPSGGSPPALWTTASFRSTEGTAKNSYVVRVPLATPVPDARSGRLGGATVRPAVAWSGDRLWMVAEHGGALQYRVRRNGFWSGWYPFTVGLAAKGGAAVAASTSGVEVFVRAASDSRVYGTMLTTPTCAPGSCRWSGWTRVTDSPVTRGDPAVTFRGVAEPTLVVRTSGGLLRYTNRSLGVWSPWTAMTGLTAAEGASVAWNPVDSTSWVVARLNSAGRVHSSRILGDTVFTPWVEVGGDGAVPWKAAPAIASNGVQLRVFAPAKASPFAMYQTIWDGTSWGSWRPLSSGARGTRQAAVTSVNGEINVVSYTNRRRERTDGAEETSVDGPPPS